MSSHDKALDSKKKHTHSRGSDGKCKICNEVMKGSEGLDEKGEKPKEEYKFNVYKGAKNNASDVKN